MKKQARLFLLAILPAAAAHHSPVFALQGQQDGPSEDETPSIASPQSLDEPSAETSDDRTVDEIYRDVFGRDRPAPAADIYPVLIDGINVGQTNIRPDSPDRDGSVDPEFVSNLLAPLTIEDTRIALEKLGQRTQVTFSELTEVGLEVEFDANNLALIIDIPLEARGIRNLNLRALGRRGDIEFVQQADVSAYLSGRAGIAFVEDSARLDEGFDRLVADFDLALNVKGVVLEADIRYDERRDRRWSRGDVRLTYDLVDSLIRTEAGDLSIGRRPYQAAPRIAGFAAYRNFGIDPYRNVRPVPDQLFELNEPSRVEVLINGIASRTFDLPSGRFSLRDFPLVPSAANNIELRITSASGRVSIVSFPAFYDLDLLQQGLLDFAANVGFPYRDENGYRRYDTSDHNIIGYARYGFTNTLTGGLSWQSNSDYYQLGADAVWASPVGTFGVNAATDISNPGLDSSQLTLQYRWRDSDRTRNRSIDGLINLTGRDYRTLDQLFSGNFIAKQARFRAGQNVGPNASAQLFGGYESLRDGLGESWFVGANYTRQFRFGSVSAGLEYRDTNDRKGVVLQAALSIPFGQGSLNGSLTSEDNAARLEYNRFAPVGVGAFGFRASAERREGSDRQLMQATYVGNRFEASVAQRADNYFSNSDRRDLRTEMTFGTALVMADGQFGVSRPVRNAFAIIAPRAGADQYQIAVEPRTGFGSNQTQYSAYSGTFGPAVVPQLPAYLNRSLQVDAPDAPSGISIGGQVFSIRPGYRSGYLLPVGDERNVTIVGNIVGSDGVPIAYAVGTSEPVVPSKESEPTQIFTNSTGRFLIEGAEAGKRYRITLDVEGQIHNLDIDVPAEFSGIFKLEQPLALNRKGTAIAKEEDGL